MRNKFKTKRGFTLFVSIMVTMTLLVVAMGIIGLVYQESIITSSSRESQYAFYAADTGAECAIYWDIKGNGGVSVFASSTSPTPIQCNRDSNNPQTKTLNQWTINHVYLNGYATTSVNGLSYFQMVFLPDPYCAKVTVVKGDNGTTKIESYGYNTGGTVVSGQSSCSGASNRRVERAVRVTY